MLFNNIYYLMIHFLNLSSFAFHVSMWIRKGKMVKAGLVSSCLWRYGRVNCVQLMRHGIWIPLWGSI